MLHEALQMIHNKQMSDKQRQRKISVNENARRMQTSTKSLQNLHNMTRSAPQLKTTGGNSFVAAQKLRESKWFKYNENKILLSVVENGFILEKRIEGIDEEHLWGIALWESGHGKSHVIYPGSSNRNHYVVICNNYHLKFK